MACIAGSFVGGILGRILGLGDLGLLLGIACAAGLIWYFRRRGKPAASGTPPGLAATCQLTAVRGAVETPS